MLQERKDLLFSLIKKNKIGGTINLRLCYYETKKESNKMHYSPTTIQIPIRLSSYFWLLRNFRKVLEKRKTMQSFRKVNDSELLKMMSYKLINTERTMKLFNIPIKTVNKLMHLYC